MYQTSLLDGLLDPVARGIAGGFGRQLESLMGLLEGTTPHYVRCIKPNQAQSPGSIRSRSVGLPQRTSM